MSNTQVGSVYNKIIEEVIENCHVAFEEEGVEPAALEELRKTWQKHLSGRQCASMPWEPAPQPVLPTLSTLSSNSARPQPQPLTGAAAASSTSASNIGSVGVQIKAEPGSSYDLQNLPLSNGIPASYGNQAALQRAGQNLHAKFGDSASIQVNQLQARAALAAQAQAGARPGNQQPPVPLTAEQQRDMEQRRRAYALQQQRQNYQNMQNLQQAQQAQQRTTAIKNGQTDGASDWNAMVVERRAHAQQVDTLTYDADMTIRQQVDQMSREMEGGGLMLPLSEHPKQQAARKRKAPRSNSPSRKIAQLDGRNDSDDDDDKAGIKDDPDLDDEDAINSDLDDPDDNVVDETEEEGNQGEVMLCTYDKVQRVKNKWKCTLKDGVLTTGGKEYVFHKATGEFEW
ncbi:transcription factor IIA subunit alpha [Xylographa bjoerkii]|nr:transcription factor IIA subunit alpha [Xylographa bjoerkii]